MVDHSLYFHIPFCTRKCDYCHFYVIPDREQHQTLLMNALKKEWELRSPLLPEEGLSSIYFGGGTPALLGAEKINEILSWIDSPDGVEITLEGNPENEKFDGFEVNRLSLGVQSFDDTLLKALGRTHSASQAIRAVEEAKVENISIDLMYDLPGQTLESWEKTLDQAIKLPITHLSLYNLTIEPHTIFYKKRESLRKHLPSDALSLKMLETAVDKLTGAGFERYEISAFAKPCFRSSHNSGYWTGRPFLGFGPSAFSYWGGSRFRNIANLNQYAKREDPTDFQETLSEFESLKERTAIGLRLLDGISIPPLNLDPLIEEGWMTIDHDHLKLTEKGILFHDTVAEKIMALDKEDFGFKIIRNWIRDRPKV